MDSIGGMLNPIGQMPKTHYKKDGILMETIGISVMVSIGLLLFCFSRDMIIVRVCVKHCMITVAMTRYTNVLPYSNGI